MSKYLIVALATAGSLLAGAAFAGDEAKTTQKPAATSKSTKSTKEAKPSKEAATPTAGASSTTVTTSSDVVAMAPIPDTKENRAKYGKPLSAMGRQTATRGN